MIRILLFVSFYLNVSNGILYDNYYGIPITEQRINEITGNNALETCTSDIEPCDENEVRRLDGTCNNLKNPSRGGFHTPHVRLLPPDFGKDFEPRKTKSGKTMMSARRLRNAILKVGDAKSPIFVQTVGYFAEFAVIDVVSISDVNKYVLDITYCCEEKGKTDYMCTPNFIPEDDPVHRFSGLRCINQTRPMSFQTQGCLRNNTTPERIDTVTLFMDLSNLYYFEANVTSKLRAYKGGLLKVEVINGKEFASDGNSSCMIQDAIETDCERHVPNGVIGSNMFTTFFWRLHNHFARNLAKINPCWDDEKLFYTARDLNIVYYLQILFHEFWPLMLGRENMIKQGIISNDPGFRKTYNPNLVPYMELEYAFGSRWFHTIQAGIQKMYDADHNYIRDKEIVDYALKVHDMSLGRDLSYLIHGAILEPSGGIDDIVDPLMGEICLGPRQKVIDIFTQDLNKGRYFGFQPYNKYRDLRMNYTKSHKTFEDLAYIIPEEKLDVLKDLFESTDDIELMTGILLENYVEGGHVPDTVAFILSSQLKRTITNDRHWYEREDRPHAFTLEQLHEMRKSTLAGLLCTVGDEVTRVQRHAFLRINSENPTVSCSKIPSIDFTLWKDESCQENCK